MKNRIIYIIIGVVSLIIGVIIGINLNMSSKMDSPQDDDSDKGIYSCINSGGEFHIVEYVDPYYSVNFWGEKDEYFFNVTIHSKDSIDFSDYDEDMMYISISLDGSIPFSILETNLNIIEVPLVNGYMPETYSFTISSSDNVFDEESLEIINKFINDEIDYMVFSVNLFSPSGVIVQVANSFISK